MLLLRVVIGTRLLTKFLYIGSKNRVSYISKEKFFKFFLLIRVEHTRKHQKIPSVGQTLLVLRMLLSVIESAASVAQW